MHHVCIDIFKYIDIILWFMEPKKLKSTVIFLCKHNSARSQIAEGLLKELNGQYYDVYTAGTNPNTLNPYTVKVMADRGIDITNISSKGIDEFKGKEFDYIVTLCDEEGEACPFLPGGKTCWIPSAFCV